MFMNIAVSLLLIFLHRINELSISLKTVCSGTFLLVLFIFFFFRISTGEVGKQGYSHFIYTEWDSKGSGHTCDPCKIIEQNKIK